MKSLDELIKTIATLRGPNGCPWDKEQTHKTLKRYLVEETYETLDAIDEDNPKAIMEELGDVLLQVILHAQIASESKNFNIEDIASNINKKMIKRHPHVFGNVVAKTPDEVMVNWEKLKKEENPHRKEILDGVPLHLPALLKALKVSKKVAKEGFEWEKETELWKTLGDEINELQEAVKDNNKAKKEEELGDILFMLVNIARWYKLDPEEALRKSISKFLKRYSKVKELAGKDLKSMTPKELNNLWERVKQN